MEEGIRTALCPAFTQTSRFLLTVLYCFSLYAFYTISMHVCNGTYVHEGASMRMPFLNPFACVPNSHVRLLLVRTFSLEHMLTNPPFLSCDVLTSDSCSCF